MEKFRSSWRLEWSRRFFVLALAIFGLGVFTSLSLSALGHVCLVLSCLFLGKQIFSGWGLSQKMLTLLVVVSFVSCLVNWNEMSNPLKSIFKLKYFVIGILGASLFRHFFYGAQHISVELRGKLSKIFLFATTAASVSGLIGLWSGYNPLRLSVSCHYFRACGMYGHFISYGYGIFFVVLTLFGLWVFRTHVKKYLGMSWIYVPSLINGLGLYLSYTRGALVGLILCAPFYFMKNKMKYFWITLASLIGLLAIALSLSWSLRFTFFDIHRVRSNDIRISMYKTAWLAFKEKPLLGLGYRNFEPNSKRLKEKYQVEIPEFASHAHSNYFEALASTGLLGLIALLLWLGSWLWETYRRKDWWGQLFFPVVLGVIATGVTQYTLGDGETLFTIMALYGLSQVSGEGVGEDQSERVRGGEFA